MLRAMKRDVEGKAVKLSITEGGKEAKCKVIASCSYVEEKLRECSKKGSSRTCNPCGNIRSRSEDENKAASSKGKVRRKK